MKKTTALLTILCFAIFVIQAQQINWDWVTNSIGANNHLPETDHEGWAIATNHTGNVYITGLMTDSIIRFGNIWKLESGMGSSYVAKFDAAGNIIWMVMPNLSPNASLNTVSIASDENDNVYITGLLLGGTANFGPGVSLSNSGTSNYFIARYNAGGVAQWVKGTTGGTHTAGFCVATDKFGHIYASGVFDGTQTTFGNVTLQSPGPVHTGNMFIVKYDNAGNTLWARTSSIPDSGRISVGSLATDNGGNLYATGYAYGDSFNLGAKTLHTPKHGIDNIILMKYDSAGTALWAKGMAANFRAGGAWVTTTVKGNLYITGRFSGDSVVFGSEVVHAFGGGEDFFIAKYDGAGNPIWARGGGGVGGGTCAGYCAAADSNENVYVTGVFEFLGGYPMDFGTMQLATPPNSANDPVFIAVYDRCGNLVLVNGLQSGGDDQNGLCVDKHGDVFFVDDYDMVNTFIVGLDTLPRTSDENVVLGKFTCVNCFTGGNDDLAYTLSAPVMCPGDSVIVSFTGGSGIVISPNTGVAWIDSVHALLKPASTIAFTVAGYSACGLLQQVSFTIPVLSGTVTITSDKQIICATDSAQICAPPGFTSYNWNTGETGVCIYAPTAGNYYVTVSENGNCSAVSNHLNLAVYPTPSVSISVHGDTLIGYNAFSYQWILNGVPIAGATTSVFTAKVVGTYTLMISDTNGCYATSTPIDITTVASVAGAIVENVVRIGPNPSSSSWMLTVPNELTGTTCEVFDTGGKLVFKSCIVGTRLIIAIESLARGEYELRIKGNGYNVERRLIKI